MHLEYLVGHSVKIRLKTKKGTKKAAGSNCSHRLNPVLNLNLIWSETTFQMETKSIFTQYQKVFPGIFFFPSAEVAEILKTGNWLKPLPLGIYIDRI